MKRAMTITFLDYHHWWCALQFFRNQLLREKKTFQIISFLWSFSQSFWITRTSLNRSNSGNCSLPQQTEMLHTCSNKTLNMSLLTSFCWSLCIKTVMSKSQGASKIDKCDLSILFSGSKNLLNSVLEEQMHWP
jgi:hypothetical protein